LTLQNHELLECVASWPVVVPPTAKIPLPSALGNLRIERRPELYPVVDEQTGELGRDPRGVALQP